MDIYIIIAIVLGALIFLSVARTLGDVGFLLAILLIGGGYVAVLANAFFGMAALPYAVVLTLAGIIVNRLSATSDIPSVAWRAHGLHATTMSAVFTGIVMASVVMGLTVGGVFKAATAVYGVLAVWHWIIAIRMAARVMSEQDDR